MRRRDVLAAVACGIGALSGCSTNSGPGREPSPTPEPTVPPDVTTVTGKKSLPTPDDVSEEAAARSFVETHERRYVYNDLVDGFGTTQPATEITVESTDAAVVYTTDEGYYLLSTCRGSAQYYDPDGSLRRAGRNAASVAHFVGSDIHRRIPFNAYRCAEPVVTVSGEGNEDSPSARFQIYDFETPPNYDQPDQGGHGVTVRVSDAAGEAVLDRDYRTSLPLTVQPRVTRTTGAYSLSASTTDGGQVQHDWSPSGATDPTWWALAVLITHSGDVAVRTLYPNETVGLPSASLCTRMG
jgi:hypothetical protein